MSFSGNSGGRWRSVRQLPRRTPLRVKLITAVLALVAIALAVISVVGISVVRNYLLGQADDQLYGLHQQWNNYGGPFGSRAGPVQGPDKFVIQGITDQGQVVPGAGLASISAGPDVPTNKTWISAHAGSPVTVAGRSGGDSWRVVVYPDGAQIGPRGGPTQAGTLVIGVDVTSVYDTIARLTDIDLLVSVIVLLGLAVVGVAVVRASLRPLTDIEETAEAIAAGDLTRRVPDRDPRTEVGRLGRSLNAMLTQIETAFRARSESETAARRSEQRMRQFVADASHELRTPLTAIRGFAEYYRQRGGIETAPDRQIA
jgi:two-component system OmpR family sensor kinase